jgi:hypothetical protein
MDAFQKGLNEATEQSYRSAEGARIASLQRNDDSIEATRLKRHIKQRLQKLGYSVAICNDKRRVRVGVGSGTDFEVVISGGKKTFSLSRCPDMAKLTRWQYEVIQSDDELDEFLGQYHVFRQGAVKSARILTRTLVFGVVLIPLLVWLSIILRW